MRSLGFIVAIVLAASSSASAEKVKANQSAKVLNRPGEQGKVVAKVKEGQNMTVIGKEGRWLKVRVSGRTGYVPRSKVDMASDDDIVRNTRRRPFVDGRGTKRGFGTSEGPDDRVGADATSDGTAKTSDDDGSDDGGDDKPDKPKKHAKPPKDDDDGADKPKKHHKDDDDDKPKKHHKDDDDDVKVDDDDSKIDDKAEDAPADERPMAHVSEKTKIYSERSKDSDVAFTAKPSDVLYPTDTKGKWTMVETDEGDPGWVLTSKLDLDDSGEGGPVRKREIDLNAQLGFTLLTQGMRTIGSTNTNPINVDNYNIGTSAVVLAIGAGVVVPYQKDYLIGGEGTLDYAKTAFGGIKIPTTTTETGLAVTNINVRAMVGKDFHKKTGIALFGRLGYRYQNFAVDDYKDMTKNPAKLPQEVLQAPTLGAALVIPRLTDKLAVRVALDAILLASKIQQTTGLEDGSAPSATAVTLNGGFTYHYKKEYDLQGMYELNYASYDFGAPLMTSTRGHTGTGSARTDVFHAVTFGVAKSF